jgi:hypothetical protein
MDEQGEGFVNIAKVIYCLMYWHNKFIFSLRKSRF